ncbi:TolC family protein [Crenobacter cavernae]|uniref:TolC family protein n=1 Tax=Crenobacter cavernae TaxID=2290923 RepID=A0A345Y9L8_9NEIS|nr:TolC family protein [Crenobacter cavernae]AXK40620.1 TolC family protein [Crenobacter cavernae]
MSPRWMLWTLPLAGLAGLVHAAPLSFNRTLEIAERQSPILAANAAQTGAAQSTAVPAGALPDPKLIAGVDNYPVSGMDAGHLKRDFMTMQKIGLMQEFPNPAKRRAREDVASANVDVAEAQRRIERLKVRRETALAWLNRFYVERKVSLYDELARENRVLAIAVKAQIAAGRGQIADAVMPKQEAAQLADRSDELQRDIAKARADLRRYVGAEADEALAGEPPALPVDAQRFRERLDQQAELHAFGSAIRRAEAELREADAMKKPDWGVELAYQRRAPQFGNMVSVQFTVDLPVSPSTRQDPLIEAKRQELVRIDAEREAMRRERTFELENTLAELAAVTHQVERARQTSLPLAREKIDLQTASYQAGKGDLAALLAARRELIDQRLKVIDLEGQRAALAARLHFAYGETER